MSESQTEPRHSESSEFRIAVRELTGLTPTEIEPHFCPTSASMVRAVIGDRQILCVSCQELEATTTSAGIDGDEIWVDSTAGFIVLGLAWDPKRISKIVACLDDLLDRKTLLSVLGAMIEYRQPRQS